MPPENRKAIALRVSSGSSMINDDLSHEVVAVDVEDAIRMNADCMAVQTFIGADGQLASIDNLSRVINAGFRYSIPTLGVVAVGKDMERTDRFFKLATRIVAEMGVQMVKTYYCDNFEEVVAACPVPIVVAGGKKLPENEALTLAARAAWIWAVTSSRASTAPRWPRPSARLCTRASPTRKLTSSTRI